MNQVAGIHFKRRLQDLARLRLECASRDVLVSGEGVLRAEAKGHAVLLAYLGDYYVAGEDYEQAERVYDEAAQLETGSVRYLYNRASVRRFLGRIEDAELDFDQVLSIAPTDGDAWNTRSSLRLQTPERNHVDALRRRIASGFRTWQEEVPVRFALAKELEDLGQFKDSWRELSVGASIRRRHLEYDLQQDLATVQWLKAAFPSSMENDASGSPEGPIFIVGMPRTGTTLLERVLAGDPSVRPVGELVDLSMVVAEASKRLSGAGSSREAMVAAASRVNFGSLGKDYLARVRWRARGSARFIDKMPLNYLYCGIIRRALPNARILHMTRHPVGTCYAMYKTLFSQGYPCSYDLGETAAYYVGYRELMAHWSRVCGTYVLDVEYERLVEDPEGESKRVFEFCGLKWRPQVLEIEKLKYHSTTASASQIRRGIYSSSLDIWRHYVTELQPISDALQAAGIL